ncbi:hypothetical protein [Mycolicibacterium mageritense]|uniref:hypothetical protein n=1 Tax=Mycolicibacterium mageritense TaxID=53462 RepID=UPI001E3F4551|nr:hypothetical protein [Mycolicibacterium mageritense]MCC9184345.1 hypothetical protein [Mycolicibacterium mageritense]
MLADNPVVGRGLHWRTARLSRLWQRTFIHTCCFRRDFGGVGVGFSFSLGAVLRQNLRYLDESEWRGNPSVLDVVDNLVNFLVGLRIDVIEACPAIVEQPAELFDRCGHRSVVIGSLNHRDAIQLVAMCEGVDRLAFVSGHEPIDIPIDRCRVAVQLRGVSVPLLSEGVHRLTRRLRHEAAHDDVRILASWTSSAGYRCHSSTPAAWQLS